MGEYATWTLDRYNRVVDKLVGLKGRYFFWTATATLVAAISLFAVHSTAQGVAAYLQLLTISWALPIPLLVVSAVSYYAWFNRGTLRIDNWTPWVGEKLGTVLFVTTTMGVEVNTALNTLCSTIYWNRRHPDTSYNYVVQALVEEEGYRANQARFDALKKFGVVITVTPKNYETPNKTTRKARALHYATELRKASFADMTRVWVYHQDEETALSEDAILGIDEFVRTHHNEQAVGEGVILYDQNFSWRPSQVAEFARTENDLRLMLSVVHKHNPLGGFHGSHFIIRGDVENEMGWDVGAGVLTEDLVFEARTRVKFGGIFHVLKGFAHEQAALTVPDQLKQRRRWVQGMMSTYQNYKFHWTRRVTMTYTTIAWFAAVFSWPAMVLSLALGFGALIPYEGIFAGFVWSTLVLNYHRGWILHKEYVSAPNPGLGKIVGAGLVGAYTDGLSPWYALLTKRQASFQVIRKDTG